MDARTIVANIKGFFNNPSYSEEANVQNKGVMKAYIPNFLYKPPYGYPRLIDVPTLRKLAVSPYVFMVTSTIIDEVCSIEWDIVPKAKDEPTGAETDKEIKDEEKQKGKEIQTLKHIKEVKDFFYNPNGNAESFEFILRSTLRDILELDSGIIIKVFNRAGKMVQIFSRDGGTFLKNPDIYGYLGNRIDYVMPPTSNTKKVSPYYDNVLRHESAYFQYGWTAGAMPIPFGKRELIWLSRNPRSDSIYGRSPVEVLQDIIMSLIYGATFNLDFYTNNNMPDGIISLLGANAEQIKKFRERFEEQFKVKDTYGNWRKQFHKFPITSTDTKFTPFQLTSQQMEIISQQEWFSKLVWACFGITPSELGYTENSNKATELVQSKVFKRKAVRPLLKLLEYNINTQLMPEFGHDEIEFKFIEYDLNEDLEKHKLYEIQLKNGIKSVNEIRQELGLEKIEGGDKPKGPNENPFEEENQFDEDEEYEVRERLNLDEKALTTESPLTLKKKEKIDKILKRFLKEKEEAILDMVKNVYNSNKLTEVKTNEYKDLWSDLIGKVKDIFTPTELKTTVSDFVKNMFMKGLDKSENKYNMNFIPDQNKIDFIKDYSFDLIKNMTTELKDKLSTSLQRAYMNDLPMSQVKEEIKDLFDKTDNRVDAIVRTESTRIDNIGQLDGAKQSGLNLKKELMIVNDSRTTPLCKRMHNKYKDNPIGLDEKFKDAQTGEEWESPPFHVNCRSGIKTVQVEEKTELKHKYRNRKNK